MESISVMIVEDEGLIAIDIATQLGRGGYAVNSIAGSGEEALANLSRSHPDLILMDIKLKGKLDGIETAMRVRSEHKLPVVFLTSHTDNDTLTRAAHAQPFGYLVKPFRQMDLRSSIEMAIHKHRCDIALMEREAWLSSVLQSTPNPTVVIDNLGIVRFLNPSAEKLLHTQCCQAAGSKWTDVVPLFGPDGEAIDDQLLLETCDLENNSLREGLVLRSPSGTQISIEGEASRSIMSSGPAGIMLTIRDVSARHEQEARVREEQKMLALGRLAGGVAHDFNNLLTIIVGHVSLLASEETRAESRRRIGAVLDAATTAVGITEQLLTLSGNHLRQPRVLDVNDRIKRLQSFLMPDLGVAIEMVLKLDASAGKIQMDPVQFDRLILNLVMNAREVMPEGGTVTISSSEFDKTVNSADGPVNKGFIRLVVQDTGPGISSEVKIHLFEPFYTTKDNAKARGLGLSIVYGIVTDAGGEVTVESTLGSGASFGVLIPRIEEQATAQISKATGGTENGVSAGTILLAEDDSIVRELVHEYLSEEGFDLIIAEDGLAALEAARSYVGRIDLLLSDVRMPNMDGFTLSKEINISHPETRTLLMSGYVGDSATFSLDKQAMVSFIQKPFTPPGLLERIRQLTAEVCALTSGSVGRN